MGSFRDRRQRLTTAVIVTGLMTGTVLFSVSSPVAAKTSVPITYSDNYGSGYQVTSTTPAPTSVTVQFTVPSLSRCSSATGFVVAAPELGNFSGSDFIASGVELGCVNGSATYTPVYTAFATDLSVALPTTVSPGDALTLSLSMTPSQSTSTFTDHSTGRTITESGKGIAANAAYIGTNTIFTANTGTVYPFPKFSPMSFTGVQVSGEKLSSFNASTGLSEYIQTTNGDAPPGGTIQMLPSALTKSSSFKITWKHS